MDSLRSVSTSQRLLFVISRIDEHFAGSGSDIGIQPEAELLSHLLLRVSELDKSSLITASKLKDKSISTVIRQS